MLNLYIYYVIIGNCYIFVAIFFKLNYNLF